MCPDGYLTDDGFWIRDPSDEFLREGIGLTYTVNPTATAFVTYPPESAQRAPTPTARSRQAHHAHLLRRLRRLGNLGSRRRATTGRI